MQTGSVSRYGWVDIAKGICIVAVVCYYANTYLGYMRPDTGWLAHWAQFARPFRMPDFFLLSGLFLSRVIDRPWRSYLDTKVVHYAYFLVLWSALYFAWRVASGELQTAGAVPLLKHYIYFLIHPMAALWFIQTLAAFFVVTRLLRKVPTFALVALAAAGMLSRFHTGFSPVDNFLEYYVFFVIGARLAEPLFHWADAAGRQPRLALAGFGVWVLLNLWVTGQGWNKVQGVDLPWSMVCILAVIALSRLLSDSKTPVVQALRYLGRNSIVVYLGFYLPLLLAFELLGAGVKTWQADVLGLLLVVVGVGSALLLHEATRRNALRFLFERPAWARLVSRRSGNAVAPADA